MNSNELAKANAVIASAMNEKARKEFDRVDFVELHRLQVNFRSPMLKAMLNILDLFM